MEWSALGGSVVQVSLDRDASQPLSHSRSGMEREGRGGRAFGAEEECLGAALTKRDTSRGANARGLDQVTAIAFHHAGSPAPPSLTEGERYLYSTDSIFNTGPDWYGTQRWWASALPLMYGAPPPIFTHFMYQIWWIFQNRQKVGHTLVKLTSIYQFGPLKFISGKWHNLHFFIPEFGMASQICEPINGHPVGPTSTVNTVLDCRARHFTDIQHFSWRHKPRAVKYFTFWLISVNDVTLHSQFVLSAHFNIRSLLVSLSFSAHSHLSS